MLAKLKSLKLINKSQWLLFLVSTLMWIGVKLGQFMMRTQGQSLSSDVKWIAAAVGVSGLAGFIVRFPLGMFADRIPRKGLLVQGSLLLSIAGALVYLFSPGIHTLYVYNLCMGVTICSYVMLNVLFSDISNRSGVVIDIAILAVSNNIGSFAAPMLGGYLIKSRLVDGITQYDFSNFITAKVSCFLLCAAFVFSLFVRDNGKPVKINIKKLFDCRLVGVSILGLIVTFMKYATLKYSFESIVREAGGLPYHVGNIDANYDILHIIGGFLAGALLSKKIGAWRTVCLGTLVMSITLLAAYFGAGSLTVFLVLNLFAGLGMGTAYIMAMSMSIENCEHKHSRMGFFQAVYMFGVYFAPKACEMIVQSTGALIDIYIFCFVLGMVSIVITLLVLALWNGRRAKLKPGEP